MCPDAACTCIVFDPSPLVFVFLEVRSNLLRLILVADDGPLVAELAGSVKLQRRTYSAAAGHAAESTGSAGERPGGVHRVDAGRRGTHRCCAAQTNGFSLGSRAQVRQSFVAGSCTSAIQQVAVNSICFFFSTVTTRKVQEVFARVLLPKKQ